MSNPVDDTVTRRELQDALRFLHTMLAQGQLELERIDTILSALVTTLLETSRLDARRIEELLPEISSKLRERTASRDATVDVGPSVDKYTVESPDVDCASLLPICLGRCCYLTFALSFQDLDERVVRWDYRRPYRILQGADGKCVHANADATCGVYDKRPGTCRRYDCRKDSRIWQDFDKRIPAPLERLAPSPLVQIKKRPRHMDPVTDPEREPDPEP
jgi:hypothetical protein